MIRKISKKRNVDREGQEQAAIFNWLHHYDREAESHCFHVPNGGKRHIATAIKLKREGVKAGVPDIWLMLPRGGHSGLIIEFKASPPHASAVSKDQKAWVARLNVAGYKAVVCKGFDAAKQTITDYLSLSQ